MTPTLHECTHPVPGEGGGRGRGRGGTLYETMVADLVCCTDH